MPPWWDGRPLCAGAETRPWRPPRSVEESRRRVACPLLITHLADSPCSAFVRNACAKLDVHVLRGAWSPAECDALADAACAAADALGGWSRARHASFPTRDLPVDALLQSDVAETLRAAVKYRVLRPAAAR